MRQAIANVYYTLVLVGACSAGVLVDCHRRLPPEFTVDTLAVRPPPRDDVPANIDECGCGTEKPQFTNGETMPLKLDWLNFKPT
jgi:hypothetical protein